ncbi:extracellular solute-binding protein [Leifsonia sp. fls2-241-R2A-40a]|uniref:ABC transporter substrate-binding protein n=1 Tax=Leifsonia sp. fls2-241-R2A-40a TaxID=3040290 RepID=UPI00254E5139|nr:extracellular solute-binding protein [Leifsonia sp. fls2-241-R2A-40a]
MTLKLRRSTRNAVIAGAVALGLTLTGCTGGSGSSGGSTQTKGATITVAWMNPAPPKAALDAFTKETGITVKWTSIDWDNLQTKIAAAATSKTYFADVTDVDWSRVGQLSKLDWFYPIDNYIDTKKLKADMPQLTSFESGGKVIGIPFDSSYMVTTVNKDQFAKAGITTMPTTMSEYTDDLKQIKAKGISATPLNIPFAAAEGLSTYWYEATEAFGGTLLDAKGKPQFASPDSGGYKAAKWMIDSLKDGLVPAGNINVTDSQGMQNLMAKGVVSSTFSDYSGNVGSLYDVPASSSVVGKTGYIPTPGVDGTTSNLGNPDGIGIPKQAKYPAAAAKFIEWITASENQADFAGANGPDKVMPNYPTPSRLSAMKILTENGKLAQGAELSELLSKSKPVFATGAPSWYPEFSRSVSTNLHSAAVGTISVDAAIKAIAAQATKLANGS